MRIDKIISFLLCIKSNVHVLDIRTILKFTLFIRQIFKTSHCSTKYLDCLTISFKTLYLPITSKYFSKSAYRRVYSYSYVSYYTEVFIFYCVTIAQGKASTSFHFTADISQSLVTCDKFMKPLQYAYRKSV